MRKIYCPTHRPDLFVGGHFRGNRGPQTRTEHGRRSNRLQRARNHQSAAECAVQIATAGAEIRVRKNRQRLCISRGVIGKTGVQATESLAVHGLGFDPFRYPVLPTEFLHQPHPRLTHASPTPHPRLNGPPNDLPDPYRSAGATISANEFRARFKRDFTVPRLHFVMSAISS